MELYLQSLAVAGVIGALLFATRAMRRGTLRPFNRGGAAKTLEAMERIQVNPQLSIHVIRIGSRQVAIAAHNSGITVLDTWGEGTPPVRPDLKIELGAVVKHEAGRR